MKTGSKKARRPASGEGAPPHTLSIDIGGTHVKCSVLDGDGNMIADKLEADTPNPATPETVMRAIADLGSALPRFDRVSAGFPGVVRRGHTLTAPNLGNAAWHDFDLASALSAQFDVPARVLNDATVQGLGVVEGHGLECVITLGTGVGCATYRNRCLLLQLEFGQHPATRRKTYDEYVGDAAREKKGKDVWNKRVRNTIGVLESLINYDVLYIGGGNARRIEFTPPENVRIVQNIAGITGGVRLWDPVMEEHFA